MTGVPMTGSDAMTLARVADLVRVLYDDLDVLSYYNLLGVPPQADGETVREAYHGRALLLHPDRYLQLPDEALRGRIGVVYKRIAEAYRVLARPEERASYDALLAQGHVRYSAEAAAGVTPAARSTPVPGGPAAGAPDRGLMSAPKSGSHISSPQARQLYDLAKDNQRRMEFTQAVVLLEQAVAVEPRSEKLRAALAEAQRLKKMYGS